MAINKNHSQYSAAITGGGFMFSETDAVLPLLQSPDRESLIRDDNDKKSLRSKVKHLEALYDEIGKYQFAAPIKQARDMFDGWLSERDPLKFFNAVIAQSKEAAQLMDTCKEVVQFKNDQMQNYRSVIAFVKDNTDNFFEEQSNKIWGIEHKTYTTDDGASGDAPSKLAAEPTPVTMSLTTRTLSPLNNEQDVDSYLAKLKTQIMDVIHKGNSVIIIK